MTEQKNQLASLFAACWKDEALKARLMSDPKAVLAEYGMPMCLTAWMSRWWRTQTTACTSRCLHRPAGSSGTLR